MTIELADAWLGVYKFKVSKDDAKAILDYLFKHQITCKQIKDEE